MGLRGVPTRGQQSSGRQHETARSSSDQRSPCFPVYRHTTTLSFALAQQAVAMLEAQLASTTPGRTTAVGPAADTVDADTVDASTLHTMLTAHAGEIARVARSAPDDAHVLAVVDHAGHWLGVEAL